jgi:transcriptional regulator GlxA family with amidase domain
MSGFNIEITHDLSLIDQADTVIMPAWRDPDEPAPDALLNALRNARRRGARLVGLCLGTFVMAEAGLLDGRTATTHWAWSDDFVKKFPRVTLNRHALYIEDDGILTSAGTAAAIDCCLQLIRADHGADIANRIARRLVVAPQRHGDQAQYIEVPLPTTQSADAFGLTLDWAIEHLGQPLCLDLLASKASMSRRSFTRRFRDTTGTSFSQWILGHRLNAAQRLLETTDKSLDHIATIVGFGSTVSFRLHFTRAFSISPGAYRKQFNGLSR